MNGKQNVSPPNWNEKGPLVFNVIKRFDLSLLWPLTDSGTEPWAANGIDNDVALIARHANMHCAVAKPI